MSDIKRYTFRIDSLGWFDCDQDDAESDTYVLASDYDALAQQLAEASKERDALKKELADERHDKWIVQQNKKSNLESLNRVESELTACKASLEDARAALQEVRLVIRQPLAMRVRNDIGNRIDQLLVNTLALKPSDAKEKT